MPVTYYGSAISPHIDRTPEGFLICRDVPVARTGPQRYLAREMQLDGDPERLIDVNRHPEDVFEPATLASLEGKPVTDGHPAEGVTAENYSSYTKGHIQNVRRDGDFIVADLLIYDASLASDIENGVKREVSCGYTCNYVPDGAGYKQSKIRCNHLAVVPRGRAGHDVAIHDAAPEAEKGRTPMNKLTHAILTAFGMAAREATPEDLDGLVQTTSTALDAVPADMPAQDAEPAEPKKTSEEPTEDAVPAEDAAAEPAKVPAQDEDIPKGDDIGSKIDRILAMLEAKGRGGRGEHPLHDESDLDDMIEKLAGKEDGKSITLPVEEAEDTCTGPARDAALAILRNVRPVIACIADEKVKARVTDALLASIRGKDNLEAISAAATDSAKAAADASSKTTYEQMCADAESAYAARNPHMKKEG